MPRFLTILLAIVLALGAALPTSEAASFPIEVTQVPLNPLDAQQAGVGSLRYRGGLWLRAKDERFGGLSDLRVTADGSRVVMVSDCGYVLRASLVYDARGFLTGVSDPQIEALRGPGERPLRPGEEDAECLAPDADGGFAVGFERLHRLWKYAAADLSGAPVELPIPAELARAPGNLGAEAMTRLADGRLLLLSEGPPDSPSYSAAWAGQGTKWSEWRYRLVYDPVANREPFRPTSAATLPDGDVLVLERRYPPVGARVRRLEGANLRDGGDLTGTEVARLELPLTVDNYEGIDVRTGSGGETLVYMLSDDNGCRKLLRPARPTSQRTLLLLFTLAP